jgi:adenylosuccinate lyase
MSKSERKARQSSKSNSELENIGIYDFFSPTDFRYAVPELRPFLSEQAYVDYKAKVEAALARQLAKEGICPRAAAEEIERACEGISAEEVYAEEKIIKHDIRALANVIRKKVSDDAKPYVHLTATSYDIVDTANALRFKDAIRKVIIPDLVELELALVEVSKQYASTVQVGRTHGQHAEPITFGFYLSFYVSRIGKRILKIQEASNELSGKFAGAVGVYGPLSLLVKDPEKFEKELLSGLGLEASEVSTQIVQPEPIADLIHSIVSTFGVLANFSRDMRNLQRTEIGEIAEQFASRQVGSSTMPQKRNPINFENVESLWKKFMPQMVTVYLDQVSEHQRDLTNSSSQRYLAELLVIFDYCVRRLTRTLWDKESKKPRISVDLKNIERNLSQSLESMAAEPFYILSALSGDEDAHERARLAVQKSISEGSSFLVALTSDPELKLHFEKIPKNKRKFVENPLLYTGIASRKTMQVAKHWEKALRALSKND